MLTLEALERAADSLGMPRQRKDGALLVKIRPWSTWIKIVNGSWVSTHNLVSPQWLREIVLLILGIALLSVALNQQFHTGRFTASTGLSLFAGVALLLDAAYSPWYNWQKKKKLFAKAAELT
jgi:hypothetical protein